MTERADARLGFGSLDLTGSATEFPNVLDLGKTTAGGLYVAASVSAAAGGTSVTLRVRGSDNGSTYTDIAQTVTPLSALDGTADVTVGIPRGNRSRYLKLAVTKTGTFTKGALTAYLDTYVGK